MKLSHEGLLGALAWYYDEVYDGPETQIPDWVREGRETMGELLAPERGLREREEALEKAIEHRQDEDQLAAMRRAL